MNCPACNIPLVMADRQGVEIDYCSRCRGVWLDRGEIDKIVEREAAAYGPTSEGASSRDERGYGRDRDDAYRHDDKHRPKKKRESFLENLLDFG